MRTRVQILDDYQVGVEDVIDELKKIVPPVTIVGKEYVAVVIAHHIGIFSVNIGAKIPSLDNSIFTENEISSLIGLVPIDNVEYGVVQLIHKYWEKMRMRADKEVALMFRETDGQKVENL